MSKPAVAEVMNMQQPCWWDSPAEVPADRARPTDGFSDLGLVRDRLGFAALAQRRHALPGDRDRALPLEAVRRELDALLSHLERSGEVPSLAAQVTMLNAIEAVDRSLLEPQAWEHLEVAARRLAAAIAWTRAQIEAGADER